MGLDTNDVNKCLQPLFGQYEDSFQDAWVEILERNTQTLLKQPPSPMRIFFSMRFPVLTFFLIFCFTFLGGKPTMSSISSIDNRWAITTKAVRFDGREQVLKEDRP